MTAEKWRRSRTHTSDFSRAALSVALLLAWKLLNQAKATMHSSGHLPMSESAARRVRNSKARRKSRGRPKNAATAHSNGERELAAAGSLTRTKALLLAALRVWELKHRMRE
jgi:hypothetical protein